MDRARLAGARAKRAGANPPVVDDLDQRRSPPSSPPPQWSWSATTGAGRSPSTGPAATLGEPGDRVHGDDRPLRRPGPTAIDRLSADAGHARHHRRRPAGSHQFAGPGDALSHSQSRESSPATSTSIVLRPNARSRRPTWRRSSSTSVRSACPAAARRPPPSRCGAGLAARAPRTAWPQAVSNSPVTATRFRGCSCRVEASA